MIEAGAAGVHFEDQLSSAKKCGHLGGKVVVPTREFIEKLMAARLAADVCGVPTILIARTDANSAGLLLADADPRDREFIYGERTPEGFYQFRGGIDAAIARGLAYAPYADMLWCETSTPDLGRSEEIRRCHSREIPGQAAGLQLFAVVQLEEEAGRRDHREFPARTRQDGLQVPVRHAGRIPRAEHVHVPSGARLCASRHDGVLETPAGRVRRAGSRLPRRDAPAIRRARDTSTKLLRSFRAAIVHDGAGWFDRSRAIPRRFATRIFERVWVRSTCLID